MKSNNLIIFYISNELTELIDKLNKNAFFKINDSLNDYLYVFMYEKDFLEQIHGKVFEESYDIHIERFGVIARNRFSRNFLVDHPEMALVMLGDIGSDPKLLKVKRKKND